jgi:hypothetical protein
VLLGFELGAEPVPMVPQPDSTITSTAAKTDDAHLISDPTPLALLG